MPRGGRYRVIAVGLWETTEFQRLTPTARYVYLALASGSLSSFAGIGLLYVEALQRETGLALGDLEAALGELEKTPTPSTSWIVRDRGVFWCRRQLTTPSPTHTPESRAREERQPPSARLGGATTAGSKESETEEIRKYGRVLTLLERIGRQSLPPVKP